MLQVTKERTIIKGRLEEVYLEYLVLLTSMSKVFEDLNLKQVDIIKEVFEDSLKGLTEGGNLDKYEEKIRESFSCVCCSCKCECENFEKEDEDEECPCKEKKKASDNLSEFDKVIAEVIGKLAKEFDLEKTIVRAICEDDIMALRLTGGVVTMMGIGDKFAEYVKDEAYEKFKNVLKKKLNR